LKVKRPKVASLTSHFMKREISVLIGICQARGYLRVQGAICWP
jgi:hypothetical protein